MRECIFSNNLNAFWNIYALKSLTTRECSITYLGYVIGDDSVFASYNESIGCRFNNSIAIVPTVIHIVIGIYDKSTDFKTARENATPYVIDTFRNVYVL